MDWDRLTVDPHGGDNIWRFKFLESVQENLLYHYVSEVIRVRGADVPSKLELVFTHSNTSYTI